MEAQERIGAGSLVGLRKTYPNHKEHPESQECLDGWRLAYGRGPFRVSGRLENPDVVALRETRGEDKILHFGSIEDPFISMTFVEPWKE